jgi:cyclase
MNEEQEERKKDSNDINMHQNASYRIFQNAYRLRGRETNTEKMLWSALKQKKLGMRFRRQHPIGSYIVDFYCHKAQLVIEIDGEYHLNEDQILSDRARSNEFEETGLKVIRFSNHEIESDLQEVLEIIKGHLC